MVDSVRNLVKDKTNRIHLERLSGWIDIVFVQFLSPFRTWPAYTQVFLVLANDAPVEDILAVLHIPCHI